MTEAKIKAPTHVGRAGAMRMEAKGGASYLNELRYKGTLLYFEVQGFGQFWRLANTRKIAGCLRLVPFFWYLGFVCVTLERE